MIMFSEICSNGTYPPPNIFYLQTTLIKHLDEKYPEWQERFGGTIVNKERIVVGWVGRTSDDITADDIIHH